MKKAQKILIIEDDKSLAEMLRANLAGEGFDVKIAFDGEEGIALLKKEKYALILLDLIMPKVDGFDVINFLKGKKNKTPILVLSNLNSEIDINIAKSFGVKEYFVKGDTSLRAIAEWVVRFLR